jgi:RimJ/RimL family protein N-acetyltransferase
MRECWGGGYNMAVKKNLLNYIFNFIDNVYFHVGSQNFRSQIAVKRLGATKVREYNSETNGIPFISFEYLLIKNNWI